MIRRSCTRSSSTALAEAPARRSGRATGLILAACVALFGVACKDDGSDAPSVAQIEGTYSNEGPAPALASPGVAIGPPACELYLDAFAVVQYRSEAMILPGLGGGGGAPIPGTIDDDDLLKVDHEVEDEESGFVTHIEGTLDASSRDGSLEGSLTMEITPLGDPTLDDCGPTVFAIDATRGTKSLPAPSPELAGADGDWLVRVDEIDTTCAPAEEPTYSVELHLDTDVDDASAVVTIDDDGDELSFDAVLTDDFVVAKWRVEDEGTVERNLTALRYQELVIVPQDLMIGVNSVVIDDDEGSCIARDQLFAEEQLL